MTVSLNEIKKPIEKELAAFEIMFRQSMKTKVPLLDTIMTYIVKRKGKQIRPLFVMLSAQLFGEINIRTYRGASMVELLLETPLQTLAFLLPFRGLPVTVLQKEKPALGGFLGVTLRYSFQSGSSRKNSL